MWGMGRGARGLPRRVPRGFNRSKLQAMPRPIAHGGQLPTLWCARDAGIGSTDWVHHRRLGSVCQAVHEFSTGTSTTAGNVAGEFRRVLVGEPLFSGAN